MFTGIVEERGQVAEIAPSENGMRVWVHGPLVTEDARPGDSIAVNGVCLTVAALGTDAEVGEFSADIIPETLTRTTLGRLTAGDPVNLERALRLGDRIGGHLVQGHVDATGQVLRRDQDDHGDILHISMPPALAPYVVPKGSVTVDGVSLTVIAAQDSSFSIGAIPTTLQHTTLGARRPGDFVNLETDMTARHLTHYLNHHASSAALPGLTVREQGS